MGEEEKGFVIKDKRAFSQDTAEPKPTGEGEEKEEKQKVGEETIKEAAKQKRPSDDIQLPEVNFATFVFSLSSSALFHFGEVPDPTTGVKEKNLAMAKHTIDILGMLEEKTKGNLNRDEDQLLKSILYDLRMRYVKEKQ